MNGTLQKLEEDAITLQAEVDKIEWHKKGLLRPITEEMGFEKFFYDENKKKELFTDTKNYISKRNAYFQKEKNEINLEWDKFMTNHKYLPYGEREKLANQLAKAKYNQIISIANEIFPNVDLAYKSQISTNVSEHVLGNMVEKPSKSLMEDVKL